METRWLQKERDEEAIKNLAHEAQIDELFATILVNRDIITLEQFNDYLNPKLKNMHDPHLLYDMDKAVSRIKKAIEDKEKIYVYGDYDVDGVTGTSVIYECLKVLGANAFFYIPHRLKEGYGLNIDAVQHIIDEKASLVITVDCGIRGFKSTAYAKERNLDIIVTDHHEVDPENLPQAYAIVNPKDQRGNYPFKGICGASVAFKLSWALCQAFSPENKDKKVLPELQKFLLDAMALVAIGTVADVVPLLEENRVVTHFGLMALERSENVGLKALKEVSNLSQASPITPEHVGFRLGPRINAMGRMEHSRYSVELLTTKNITTAQKLARSMEVENQKRRKLQQRIFKQALAQMERYEYHKQNVIILADEGWHPGIIGIVASRIVEKYYRPVCIIGVENGFGKSSARSIPGFNLFQALKHCEELLVAFGGHSMAAGFKIEADKISAFRRKMNEFAEEILTPEHFIPSIKVDLEITFDKIDWEFAGNIRRMSPLGEKNPPPVLIAFGVEVVMNPRPTRAGGKGEHLIFYVRQNDTTFKAVFFGQGERLDELVEAKVCDLAFSPTINTWGENHNIELMVKDMKTPLTNQGF
ncbi:single-stranded-DNA-specific exonuclease RecJ [Candidatus Uabimicrobium amorphum]|uniref:Single-stranded-DNA-specific exonuclease RecJ n=1 Tax=Uabimicrobium amorphum TaxID=2596890 RepID=A0A5S9IP18_UABAM|nr:single-stranded-DNA-specific exonuclease RecJ [Candidatus Uabimicrobium amorphum]BBM85254.1 single-stranded-DNA-specific exonuclease [Candidatus Uabimicrobium amorphum]